ncbi:DUF1479-domain-containing protein, partial [Xylariaceae sp. FL0016]
MTSTTTVTTGIPPVGSLAVSPEISNPPKLDERFAALKRDIIKPEHEEAVAASYKRLKVALKMEMERIAQAQQAAIPEVQWEDVKKNGGIIPEAVAKRSREAGCVLFRNVVPEEQALKWKAELRDYTRRHPKVGGKPLSNPVFWLLYWTRPQVQARTHPEVLAAMESVMKLWHIEDETLPIDMASQVHYADRFRIREAGDNEYSLRAHLDSSSIERWEDPKYRSNYQAIFEGRWEEWDGWVMDNRPDAKVDLYRQQGGCSSFRAMQGWLSLCNSGPGEGTLRVLPNLKLATAYIMLRPFFVDRDDDEIDFSQPTFPGATPGKGQFIPTPKYHPHLEQQKSMVSVQKVHPGDFMYWHCDLAHEVENMHNGTEDSSVMYIASTPLCAYNLENMLRMRANFRDVEPPADFYLDLGGPYEMEKEHDDHGAREENIMTTAGLQGIGMRNFNVEEPGLTAGQKEIRALANEAMKRPDELYDNRTWLTKN